ncbi:MAG: aminotransferase class III-fold pyridoxal phosphate-dependent enzyme [Fibrobacteres bacterium]|jgi:glutamate-1-semialdehyde 2,1-aminomutase|nr:aminotransferase class III-fold pyridoxal phosphate-dependent enzyme [Fibrobacterota bacterium]
MEKRPFPASKGAELWNRAKKIIPGGNQLLSKRSERFVPGIWPAYYSRAKGCEIWGVEGEHYIDFGGMGVGACILGYANDEVDEAVIRAIRDGSMSTLNCPEEIELAERLLALNPWAGMVRFGRAGGEACAIAIRIARAASGKNKVAFCGYHGWHDWYISSNLAEGSNLDDQLLPGLSSRGIARGLSGTALPFRYNRLDELEKIVSAHAGEIGVIIMEPVRDNPPEPGFLEGVRRIADRIGAVLIFDEVTSGFVMNLGGVHATLGVDPDIAVYGKALGNGYPITAVVGKTAVMDYAQETFISSTFWTERVGFTAALKAIEVMEKTRVHEKMIAQGHHISAIWKQSAARHGLAVHTEEGMPPHVHLGIENDPDLAVHTLLTQEMLRLGYLYAPSMRCNLAYTDPILEGYARAIDQCFAIVGKAVKAGTVRSQLLSPAPASTGFKRLT